MSDIIVVVCTEDLYANPWSARRVSKTDVSEGVWSFLKESDVIEYTNRKKNTRECTGLDLVEYGCDSGAWTDEDIERWGEHAQSIREFLDDFYSGDCWDSVSSIRGGNIRQVRFFSRGDY
jgi:hypothetical protein